MLIILFLLGVTIPVSSKTMSTSDGFADLKHSAEDGERTLEQVDEHFEMLLAIYRCGPKLPRHCNISPFKSRRSIVGAPTVNGRNGIIRNNSMTMFWLFSSAVSIYHASLPINVVGVHGRGMTLGGPIIPVPPIGI